MNLGIKNKTALIGGASKGLGFACAMKLAEEGANLVICSRSAEKGNDAAERIKTRTGSNVIHVVADLSTEEGANSFCKIALQEFGKIDIYIHNTGGPPPGNFFEFTDQHWQKAYELLLLSAIRMYRLVLPEMKMQKWGRIVNITSIVVKEPWDNLVLSNSLRAGVVNLSKTLSRQVAVDGICMNSVCPGAFHTERLDHLASSLSEQSGKTKEDVLNGMKSSIPSGKLGDPEMLANLVAFLCSECSAHINGVALQVDGGEVKHIL